jgi:CBS domain containing-hemolysin-like protein
MMPLWPHILGWILLAGGMALSFLYSGVETGAYVLNKVRLDLRAESGSRSARRLAGALADPSGLLAVVLAGNNLANYLASAGMVLLLSDYRHAEWLAMAILAPLTLIFCEMLPKNLFQRHAETLVYPLSWLLVASQRFFNVIGLLPVMRRVIGLGLRLAHRAMPPSQAPLAATGRLAAILAEVQAGGGLTHSQSLMAERVVNLRSVSLRSVMVPLERAVLVSQAVGLQELRELLHKHDFARYGVFSQRRENIVGALNVYEPLLDQTGSSPAAFMTPPVFLPESLLVSQALVELQQNHQMMGFAVDAQGRCTGLVTVKDLVEEIVGELEEL